MESASQAQAQSLPSNIHESLATRARRKGIPYATLWHHENGRPTKEQKNQKQRYLSPSEEEGLVQHLLRLNALGSPMKVKDISSLAFDIACQRSTTEVISPPGKNWGGVFAKRYPEVKRRSKEYRKTKGPLRQRAGRGKKRLNSSPSLSTIPNNETGLQASDRRLERFFQENRETYTDSEIMEISSLLSFSNPRWSKVPRTYIVLRSIDRLDLLNNIIDVGFSDFWFPVTEKNLPGCLGPSACTAFFNAQQLILTKSINLEKGQKGQHCYFKQGDKLPFERRGVLGNGGFGEVDRVLSLISLKEYARKRVLRCTAFRGRGKERMQKFVAEIQLLKRLQHYHIVEFVGSYTDTKYLGLIMSPVAEMDLGAYLKHCTISSYPELRTFFGCLATALDFLHGQKVRHKDIKPANILVNRGSVLFVDFGLSFDFADASCSTTTGTVDGMTPKYCAPEVAERGDRNTQSDIWSLGVVFMEMIVVLKGQTVQDMDIFLMQHGSQSACISANMAVLPKLIGELEEIGELSDNKALVWTQRMLCVEQQLRPTASSLVTSILKSVGFCGICCASFEEGFSSCEDE